MSDRRAEAEDIASELISAFAPLGLLPSVLEPETLAGRATGRLRIIMRPEDARGLARALRRHAVTVTLEQ